MIELLGVSTQDLLLELRKRGVVKDLEATQQLDALYVDAIGPALPNYLHGLNRDLGRAVMHELLDTHVMLTYWRRMGHAPMFQARVSLTVVDTTPQDEDAI